MFAKQKGTIFVGAILISKKTINADVYSWNPPSQKMVCDPVWPDLILVNVDVAPMHTTPLGCLSSFGTINVLKMAQEYMSEAVGKRGSDIYQGQ